MHEGFVSNIEKDTLENGNFRKVLYTGKFSQLVVMSLRPGEDIGMEVHDNVDQFFRIDKGSGKVIIEGVEHEVGDGFAIIIPAGTNHNVINTSSSEEMKLYTIYSPANHKDGTVHATKAEAEANEEHFDGVTTE
jgi:mannose-6-phosphate isomerase-like protein (cupin superfamily)